MTQKKQWLLFGAILGVGVLSTWALVRWGGLTAPAPAVPVGPVVVNPRNGGGNRPNTPAPPAQAVLPFNNGRGAGGAAVPNFGGSTAGGAASPFGNGGQPAGAGGAAKVPFAANNTVASNTPFGNTGNTSGGAAVPSFGTGGAGGAAGGGGLTVAAGAGTGGAMVPMFTRDALDPNDTAKHYLKQICGDRVPTLADWQKLVDMKLVDAAKWLHAPMGAGHFVMAMCLDLQNNLWVGTEGEGLYRFSVADGMWTQFVASSGADAPVGQFSGATVCGMGDNYVYALACDRQGRVWAGHLNHGVSVFNGEKWQNFEVVGGLSRPDTLNGPLGERLFHITVCPAIDQGTFKDPLTDKESNVADSVWMCTSAGLAVYFTSTDTWSYLTRADGLPSDQANSLAFANDGTAFVATQCDGLAIGSPKDGYKTWKQVARRANGSIDGPLSDELPTTPTGTGLPTNLMNDILVAKDGTVYAATTAGLACSADKGESWQFVRGKDYAAKVKGRIGGAPAGWTEQTGAILSEDYCTSLSIDGGGNLYLGHRTADSDVVLPRGTGFVSTFAADYAHCVLAVPGGNTALVGTYSAGLQLINPSIAWPSSPASPVTVAFPKAAATLSTAELAKLASPGNKSATEAPNIVYLGPDWMTQGDWVGRYGRKLTILCAAGSPDDHEIGYGLPTYRIVPSLMKKTVSDEQVRNWCWAIKSEDRSVPWDPTVALRRPAGWDDHGEAFSATLGGMGLNIAVTVPAGVHRIALYFVNYDGQRSKNRLRDYLVTAARQDDPADKPVRARVVDHYYGVYQQFVARKAGTYNFVVDRNYSFNTMLSAVLVDKWSGPSDLTDTMALPWTGNLAFEAPRVNWPKSPLAAASALLKGFDAGENLICRRDTYVQHLRYAQASKQAQLLLENLCWNINLWTTEDRTVFDKTMLAAWQSMQAINPQLKSKKWRPYSPYTIDEPNQVKGVTQ